MTLADFCKKLTADTVVTIIDKDTNKKLVEETAGWVAGYCLWDEVKDWDFSKEHRIYI